MSEDWAAVARAINSRVAELGWRQRELADRSHVSAAIVREIQRHTVERRRSPRTLESLSVTLGWEPGYLTAILNGDRSEIETGSVARENIGVSARLDALEGRLAEISRLLYDVKSDLATVIEYVRKS